MKEQNISVSVVMITYGHELYIQQAIEGVLMQKVDFEVELIIANDCSPDNTYEVVHSVVSTHPNAAWVSYTRHEKNLGMMKNFIWALSQAKGKYIALCEGDDYWTDPLKLQKQVDFMEANENITFCFHGSETMDEYNEKSIFYRSNKFKDRKIVPKENFIAKGGGSFATASSFFKKEMIKDIPNYFDSSLIGDLPLALLAISKGEIGYLKDNMSVYRLMSSSSWSKNRNNEQKMKNNENVRNVIEIFHKETDYKFIRITKKLTKTVYFHYGIYYSHRLFLRKIIFIAKNFLKLGIVYSLKLLKN